MPRWAFEGRNRAVCMARMFADGMAGNLDYYGVPALKAALGQLTSRPEVDAGRIGAIGFCLGGSIVLTWACTQARPDAERRSHDRRRAHLLGGGRFQGGGVCVLT